jgi:energy-coupling factor transporter ATP-binding protein EcfA2
MLILISGLPGSGKSTMAQKLFGADKHPLAKTILFETDEFFYKQDPAKPGSEIYRFDPEKLGLYHLMNQSRTRRWLAAHPTGTCCVANTFSQHWEMEPYVKIAAETHHQVKVYYCHPDPLTLDDLAEHNIHGVPRESLYQMAKRWEPVPAAITIYPYRSTSHV